MLNKFDALWNLVKSGLIAFRDTDFSQVQFDSLGLALGAGLFIFLLLVYKILWGKNKFRRPYSGHIIPEGFDTGNLSRFIYWFPKFLSALSVLFALVTIANPYLPKTKIEEIVESQERLDMFDASPSRGWEYENTKKCSGQIGREAYLDFLKMREGQGDSVSLWYFSASPVPVVEYFMIDDDVLMMQAKDMPYVVIEPGNSFLPENDRLNKYLDIIAPQNRINRKFNGGGTNIIGALEAAIKHFDNEGNKKIRQRALLLETDMAVDNNPEKQLLELKKRNVKLYVLHIKPNEVGEKQGVNEGQNFLNADIFRKQIERYGGKFYSVTNQRSLKVAYNDINKLEKSPPKIVRYLLKILIYQRPLLVSTILLFMAIASGLVAEKFLGEDP